MPSTDTATSAVSAGRRSLRQWPRSWPLLMVLVIVSAIFGHWIMHRGTVPETAETAASAVANAQILPAAYNPRLPAMRAQRIAVHDDGSAEDAQREH